MEKTNIQHHAEKLEAFAEKLDDKDFSKGLDGFLSSATDVESAKDFLDKAQKSLSDAKADPQKCLEGYNAAVEEYRNLFEGEHALETADPIIQGLEGDVRKKQSNFDRVVEECNGFMRDCVRNDILPYLTLSPENPLKPADRIIVAKHLLAIVEEIKKLGCIVPQEVTSYFKRAAGQAGPKH